jgi:hypothetical protein
VAKTHPHVDRPDDGVLAGLVESRLVAVREAYLALHRLVLEAVPDVEYSVDTVDASIGYGPHQYGYGGWGMAAVTPYTQWASLTLLDGAALVDPEGLLEGTRQMRHVKPRSAAQVADRREALLALVRQAAALHQKDEPTAGAAG